MGTRNITKVIKDGNTVVSQYGQWDGYPAGQGVTALNFIRNPEMIELLTHNIDNLYTMSDTVWALEIDKIQKANLDDKEFEKLWPTMSRNTCADILEVIATSEGMLPIVLELEFEFDELMCEGIYTLNLDNRTFISTYEGITLVLTFDEIQAGLPNDDYVWAFTLENA